MSLCTVGWECRPFQTHWTTSVPLLKMSILQDNAWEVFSDTLLLKVVWEPDITALVGFLEQQHPGAFSDQLTCDSHEGL